jgi:hypothetical protein
MIIPVMKVLVFVLVVGLFVIAGVLVVGQSYLVLHGEQTFQRVPEEPKLDFTIPPQATLADQVAVAKLRIDAYTAHENAVKAVVEANAKHAPLAIYTAVIKDVLLGILTTMLAAFITYAFSIAATDIGHNIALGKGAPVNDLKKFTLFG